jgi:hypothetical protein
MKRQRCPVCSKTLVRTSLDNSLKLACGNAQCPGSPPEPDEPAQLALPDIDLEEAA